MRFIDKYNTLVGIIITTATALLGAYWYLFAGYLLFNILDWLTGWYKARVMHQESSKIGLAGIIKKVGYWIIILVAFLLPEMFVNLGRDLLGLDMSFLILFGWFTLATLLVNEIRSILENLLQCGYQVPEYLIRGLALAEKMMNSKTNMLGDKHDSN